MRSHRFPRPTACPADGEPPERPPDARNVLPRRPRERLLRPRPPCVRLFTLVSAALARTWSGSTGAASFAFQLFEATPIGAAPGIAALIARRTRPERVSLAVVLVGRNPVIVVHAVRGGHLG